MPSGILFQSVQQTCWTLTPSGVLDFRVHMQEAPAIAPVPHRGSLHALYSLGEAIIAASSEEIPTTWST